MSSRFSAQKGFFGSWATLTQQAVTGDVGLLALVVAVADASSGLGGGRPVRGGVLRRAAARHAARSPAAPATILTIQAVRVLLVGSPHFRSFHHWMDCDWDSRSRPSSSPERDARYRFGPVRRRPC